MDHSDDRTLDWKSAAPRWLLLALICGGAAWGSFSSIIAWNLYQASESDKERRYSDWKGGAVADHEYRITTLEREAKNTREEVVRIDAATRLVRLQMQMETLAANMATLTQEVRRSLKEK